MSKVSGLFPFVLCGVLIILSVLLVIVGHRQGDANAIIAAKATAAAASAKPTAASTVQLSASPSAAAAAASALAKPAAAD